MARVRRSDRPEPARAGEAPAVPVAVAVPIADGLFTLARGTDDVADTVRVEDHCRGAAGHLPHAPSARAGRTAVRTEVTSHARFIGSLEPPLEAGLVRAFATPRGRRTWDSDLPAIWPGSSSGAPRGASAVVAVARSRRARQGPRVAFRHGAVSGSPGFSPASLGSDPFDSADVALRERHPRSG